MEYWPVLETKCRKLILDLIEPTVRRTNDQKVQIDQLRMSEDAFSRKLDSHDTMLERINNRLTMLDDFARRLIQFESDLRIYDIKSENERSKIKEAAELLTERVKKNEENIENLFGKAECLRLDNQMTSQNLNNTRSVLADSIEIIKTEMVTGFNLAEENRKNLELAYLNTEKKVKTTSKDLAEVDLLAKQTARSVEEYEEKIDRIFMQLTTVQREYKEQTDKIRSLTLNYNRQAMEALKKLKEQIKDQISNEQPIETYTMITELLYGTFTDLPTQKKIAEAESQILPKFESLKIPESLKLKICEFGSRSLELVNKELPKEKKKKKKKFKIADLLTMDSKIKNHEEKMTKLEEKITTIEGSKSQSKANLNDSSESESDEITSTLEVLKQNAEALAQIIGVKDFTDDIELLKQMIEQCNMALTDISSQIVQVSEGIEKEIGSINDCTDKLQQEDEKIEIKVEGVLSFLKETYSDLQALTNKESQDIQQVKQVIAKNSEDTQEKIVKINETVDNFIEKTGKNITTIEYQVQQALFECSATSTQRKRDLNDSHLEFSKIHQHADILTKSQEVHYKRIEGIQTIVNRITEFLKIGIILQYQDEIDRESIALIGYKESKSHLKNKPGTSFGKPSISLDKQCISCSGQVNMITSAFKIACLAYTPSPVNYKENTYQRLELLELQKKMIEGVPDNFKEDVIVERVRNSKTPKPNWRPVSSLSMCIPSGSAQTPDLPPISLAKRINNYVN